MSLSKAGAQSLLLLCKALCFALFLKTTVQIKQPLVSIVEILIYLTITGCQMSSTVLKSFVDYTPYVCCSWEQPTTSAWFSPSLRAGLSFSPRRPPAVASLSGPARPACTLEVRKKYSRSRKTCNPEEQEEEKKKTIRQGAASVNLADVWHVCSELETSHVAAGELPRKLQR